MRQRDSQLIETYVARDVYIVEYETLLQSGALADGVLDLTAEAVGPEYPGKAYTDLDTADWVLAADGVPVDTSALEKADAACPAGYVLYRNLDAQRVRFAVIVSGHGRIWNPPARKGVCRYRPTCFSAPQTGTGRRGRRPYRRRGGSRIRPRRSALSCPAKIASSFPKRGLFFLRLAARCCIIFIM